MDYHNSSRKCVKCGTSRNQDNTITTHRFPLPGTNNILRAMVWATYCWPDEDWSSIKTLTALYYKHRVLCSKHFRDDMYIDNAKKRLSKHAVPGTKEYVANILQSLKAKISVDSVVQQVKLSLQHPAAGSTTNLRYCN
ncbi:uncharacterized protein LOC134675541 isoform X2 [Cydia fagiglandana]|uniref:uncharacterized protein LOC134675541 isoform X2 n=1 Tax=Cydia fagiglandana TaxID=1458189 RepID=UPI002FEE35C8